MSAYWRYTWQSDRTPTRALPITPNHPILPANTRSVLPPPLGQKCITGQRLVKGQPPSNHKEGRCYKRPSILTVRVGSSLFIIAALVLVSASLLVQSTVAIKPLSSKQRIFSTESRANRMRSFNRVFIAAAFFASTFANPQGPPGQDLAGPSGSSQTPKGPPQGLQSDSHGPPTGPPSGPTSGPPNGPSNASPSGPPAGPPAGPSNGPPSGACCMTDTQANTVATNFGSLISAYSAANADAYLTPDFTDYSDSVNELINNACNTGPAPLGSPTFTSLAAFKAGQGSQADIPFEKLNVWHNCDNVFLRWRTSMTPQSVTGIIVLETQWNPAPGAAQPWLIKTVYSEFNSGSWLVDLGVFKPDNCTAH